MTTINIFKKLFMFKNTDINTILYLVGTLCFTTLIYDYMYLQVENIDSLVTLIYYNVVTASTVGYGDFSPATSMGKIITAIYIPIAISLFAAILSVIGSIIYTNINRKNNGIRYINKEVDFLIIGGFHEKIKNLTNELLQQNKSIALLNNLYEGIPLEYKQNDVLWIKGDSGLDDTLEMINHDKISNYIILSDNPTNRISDINVVYNIEQLLHYSKDKNILAEVIDSLAMYQQNKSIKYINIAKGSFIAKEAMQIGILDPITNILDNNKVINQYNIKNPKEQTSQQLQKDMSVIGYIDEANKWCFDTNTPKVIPKDNLIKLISKQEIEENVSNIQNILIISDNIDRIKRLIKNYYLDKRYQTSTFCVISSVEMKFEQANIKCIKLDCLETQIITIQNNYTHILILAESNNKRNDSTNYFYWRHFRQQNKTTKIIVELLSEVNTKELEIKYEDRQNEFLCIFQIGLIVQELQDDGIVNFIENISHKQMQEIKDIENKL